MEGIAASGNQSATTAQLVCAQLIRNFSREAADAIGLYVDPLSDNAVAPSVDEKLLHSSPGTSAGWLRMPDGRSFTRSHLNRQRHGTTMFLSPSTSSPPAKSMPAMIGERRIESYFMDQLVALHPGKELDVALDNLSIHLVEKEKWVKEHPQVHFHYISHPCLMAQSGRGLVQYPY